MGGRLPAPEVEEAEIDVIALSDTSRKLITTAILLCGLFGLWFISGIIILFERPIRIGEVVTVGDTDGTVARIRSRDGNAGEPTGGSMGEK